MKSGHLAGIRAITFDVGGTLIEPWPSVGHVYAGVVEERGLGRLDPAELNRRFCGAWQAQNGFGFTKRDWAELVANTLADLTPAARSAELFEAIWVRFTEASAWRVFSDVLPCLRAVKAGGIRCAVISNWDERLTPTLRNLGLADEFEFILASAEVGFAKPASEIFAAAQQGFNLPPDQILHVGDSRREDREGANSAGFRGVWLDRSGAPDGGDIATLTELLD
jgi:putative hydrolase of the HAD superfamily